MDSEEAMINKLKVHLELQSRKPNSDAKGLNSFIAPPICSKPAATNSQANCIECTQTWVWVPTSTTSSTTLSRRRTQWWTWVSAFRSTFYRWATRTCTYTSPHFRGGFSVQSLTLCSWLRVVRQERGLSPMSPPPLLLSLKSWRRVYRWWAQLHCFSHIKGAHGKLNICFPLFLCSSSCFIISTLVGGN